MKTQFEQDELDRMRNNPDNYKWGIFYFNPKDPRYILSKRNQWMGWTLNFANPFSYLIVLCIIAFAVLMLNFGKIH
ncbi:MAG: DUF5808 domain-containing protein [Ignavibacteriota bacterium]